MLLRWFNKRNYEKSEEKQTFSLRMRTRKIKTNSQTRVLGGLAFWRPKCSLINGILKQAKAIFPFRLPLLPNFPPNLICIMDKKASIMQMNDRAVKLLKPQTWLPIKRSRDEAAQCPGSSRLLLSLAFQQTEEHYEAYTSTDHRSLISTWFF